MVARWKPDHRRLAVSLPAALLLVGAGTAAAGDVERGRTVAERVCKRCHVIGADNLHGSIGSTPSFFLMKEKLGNYRGRILSLTGRPPHKGQDLDVSRQDLDDLLAYIATLERP